MVSSASARARSSGRGRAASRARSAAAGVTCDEPPPTRPRSPRSAGVMSGPARPASTMTPITGASATGLVSTRARCRRPQVPRRRSVGWPDVAGHALGRHLWVAVLWSATLWAALLGGRVLGGRALGGPPLGRGGVGGVSGAAVSAGVSDEGRTRRRRRTGSATVRTPRSRTGWRSQPNARARAGQRARAGLAGEPGVGRAR